MTDFRVFTIDELRPVVEAFTMSTLPSSKQELIDTAKELGWELDVETRKGLYFRTGVPVTYDRVDVLLPDQVLAQLTLRISSSLDDFAPEADPGVLANAFRQLRGSLATIMGAEPQKSSVARRYYWELASLGRLVIVQLRDVVVLIVLSERYANIERAEQRQGLDPNLPIADHQESQR